MSQTVFSVMLASQLGFLVVGVVFFVKYRRSEASVRQLSSKSLDLLVKLTKTQTELNKAEKTGQSYLDDINVLVHNDWAESVQYTDIVYRWRIYFGFEIPIQYPPQESVNKTSTNL